MLSQALDGTLSGNGADMGALIQHSSDAVAKLYCREHSDAVPGHSLGGKDDVQRVEETAAHCQAFAQADGEVAIE